LDTIRLIVRNLVVLMMVAAFLEMLLPLKETRRFVQVVIGFFVLIIVLGPVVSIWQKKLPLGVSAFPAAQTDSTQLQSIIVEGQILQKSNLDQAKKAYLSRLEEQVVVMVRLIPGVQDASAQVVLDKAPDGQSMGAVDRVLLHLKTGSKGREGIVKSVEQVKIGNSPAQDQAVAGQAEASHNEILKQVQDTVTSLFGLRPEQVVVDFGN